MNEILRIIWFAVNGLLLLAVTGITINKLTLKVREAKEASEISEASSFIA